MISVNKYNEISAEMLLLTLETYINVLKTYL